MGLYKFLYVFALSVPYEEISHTALLREKDVFSPPVLGVSIHIPWFQVSGPDPGSPGSRYNGEVIGFKAGQRGAAS